MYEVMLSTLRTAAGLSMSKMLLLPLVGRSDRPPVRRLFEGLFSPRSVSARMFLLLVTAAPTLVRHTSMRMILMLVLGVGKVDIALL